MFGLAMLHDPNTIVADNHIFARLK